MSLHLLFPGKRIHISLWENNSRTREQVMGNWNESLARLLAFAAKIARKSFFWIGRPRACCRAIWMQNPYQAHLFIDPHFTQIFLIILSNDIQRCITQCAIHTKSKFKNYVSRTLQMIDNVWKYPLNFIYFTYESTSILDVFWDLDVLAPLINGLYCGSARVVQSLTVRLQGLNHSLRSWIRRRRKPDKICQFYILAPQY
jgi:hypothetical protein